MKEILIIRKQDSFSRILSENGFQVINLPLIETKALANLDDFERRLDEIENYAGIFLTSNRAAKIFAEKTSAKKINFSGKVYVLGKKSFDILSRENFNVYFDKNANTAREMLEKIPTENLKNKNFLFVRGDKSLRVVPEFLERIAKIDETIVYETREILVAVDKVEELKKKFDRNEIAATCFFSPSQAENFIKQFGAEVLHQTVIATIGKTTAEFFKDQKLTVDFVSPRAGSEDFAIELIKYLERR